MSRRPRPTVLVMVVVLAAAAGAGGFYARQQLSAPAPAPDAGQSASGEPAAGQTAGAAFATAEAELPRPRPDFTLPDHTGAPRSVAEWDGRLLLVNFWATWCPPCLEEIPMLVELQEDYREAGLQVLGIALDEPEGVREFMDEMGMNYPVLLGQSRAMEVSKAYGNRVGSLPYTAVVSRDGRIVAQRRGQITREEAEALVQPRL